MCPIRLEGVKQAGWSCRSKKLKAKENKGEARDFSRRNNNQKVYMLEPGTNNYHVISKYDLATTRCI